MPSTRHISKPGTGHTPAGMLVLLLVLSVAIALALPAAKAYAAGTTLGILVTDSKNGQTAGKDGTTKLGIRITNSKKPIATTYTLSFNLAGAPGSVSDVTATYSLPLLPISAPSWPGYTFQGFYDGNTQCYKADGTSDLVWSKTSDTTLTARWSANTYTVTLNPMGGTGGIDSTTATFGSAMPAITLPTKTGYTFQGYFDKQSGGTKYYNADGSSAKEWDKAQNDTLYAQWRINSYTITWKANGGNFSGSTADKTTQVNYGSATTAPATPSRTGYTFKGWATSSTATTAATLPTSTTGSAIWHAVWQKDTYAIKCTLAGGSVTGNPDTYTVDSETITLKNPSRSGYTFKGWTGSNGTTPQTNVTIPKGSTGDKAYTANWEIKNYTIKYELGGGSVTGNPDTYTIESPAITLKAPSRDGYTFKGWTGSNGVTPQTSVTIAQGSTENKTYVANWEANPYTIDYDLAGGKVSKPNPTTYTIETASFTLTNPTKDGYTFAGWTGTGLSGAQKNVTVAQGSKDNRSYTATWTANKYQVLFDKDNGSGGSDSVNATFDAPMPEITIPSKDGYTFAGYFDDNNKQYYNEKGISKAKWDKDTNNVTLKAHWTLQITFSFPTAALIEVDASGNVSGPNLEFKSTTPEDIKVTAVKSTRSESAASLFADDTTLKGVRILLKPTTGGADSEVKVPLTVNETSSPANWTIAAANPKLLVGFSLSLPDGAQLNYLANDGQVSIANLSYEVSAAKASS